MKTISKEKQKAIREAYEKNFKGKNWGSWNIDNMPNIGLSFRMLQYINDNNRTCDVIKFDQPVLLQNHRRTHTTFHFQFKPNHDTKPWPTFNDGPIVRRCHFCGKYKPVNEPGVWYSSRECTECGADKVERNESFLKELEENVKKGNREKIDFRHIRYNTTSNVSADAENILKQNPEIYKQYQSFHSWTC